MKNIKDLVYEALAEKFGNVTDSYPSDWANLPAVQITEEENKEYEHTTKEDKSYVRYRVDIWDTKSTSESAVLVNKALGSNIGEDGIQEGIGLIRTGCSDNNEPTMKHKAMRFEGIIDMESDAVYWTE